jgi:hypothetical protein
VRSSSNSPPSVADPYCIGRRAKEKYGSERWGASGEGGSEMGLEGRKTTVAVGSDFSRGWRMEPRRLPIDPVYSASWLVPYAHVHAPKPFGAASNAKL